MTTSALQTNKPLVIYGARLIDPASQYDGPGAVLIENQRIVGVSQSATLNSKPDGADVLDAQGCVLAPALVDLHTQVQGLLGNGLETPATLARAALAGGVSHAVVHPSENCPLDTPEAIMAFLAQTPNDGAVLLPAGNLRHQDTMAEYGLMQEAGAALLSDGGQVSPNAAQRLAHLRYAQQFGLTVCLSTLHPDFDHLATAGAVASGLGLHGTPASVEALTLAQQVMLAQEARCRPLIGPVTTHQALETLRKLDREAMAVTWTPVTHLSFNAVDMGDLDPQYRLCPPLRIDDDRRTLIEATRTGLVPIITSSHAPCSTGGKLNPFSQASIGGAIIEDLLPAALSLYHTGDVELLTLWQALSLTPARALGIDTGEISKGAPANLVLVDLDAPSVRRAEALMSACKASPYDGRRLQGRLLKTWIKGQMMYDFEHELAEASC